jgi:AcrR family transcriptional regulator
MASVGRSGPRPGVETRERLLAAAESLFMEQGFRSTSLREITARAKVNLAAVNYHFGSKDALVREVLQRRLGPLNEARVQYLDRLEAEAAGPLPVERILEALLLPALRLSRNPLEHGSTVLRLLGRAFSEPGDYMKDFLPDQYRVAARRFQQALGRAMPHLPEPELVWRMHFTFGAIAYVMAGDDALQLVASCQALEADNPEAIVRRLVPFLAAGLQAPTAPPLDGSPPTLAGALPRRAA